MIVRRALAVLAFAALGFSASAQTADRDAAEFPSRPVRIVVPFPAGGPTDVLARFLGQHLSEQWGKGVVIENRPGANSAIGAQAVAHAQADGYTLLMAMDTTLVMNPIATSQLSYKVADFAPISMAAVNTSVLVVPANGPKTVQELIAKGRANPGKLNYGAGIIPTRLAAILFNKQAGVEATFVPYKGSSDVVQGLLDGSIDYAVDGIAPHLALIKDGKLRALAKLNNRQLDSLPGVEPLAQVANMPSLGEMSTWVGVVAPAGTPRAIVDKIQKSVALATQDKAMQSKLLPLGIVAVNSTPEEFDAFVKSETAKWGPVLRESGITMN
ncbi:MAG: Tripartite-type tricarboxylate transporter, receptor component TctC [Hyphomicrobiales bacterium]|nr:Tripartite-type tricarboxylate transporter, receptor component TctC [Hyphomicrobiales bacterium]